MKRRSAVTFLPRRISITSSVGTSTSSISSSRPLSVTDCLICSAIFFSKFERTLTEYHRFAIVDLCLCFHRHRAGFSYSSKRLFPRVLKRKAARNPNRRAPCPEVLRQLPLIVHEFKARQRINKTLSQTDPARPAIRCESPDRPVQRRSRSALP